MMNDLLFALNLLSVVLLALLYVTLAALFRRVQDLQRRLSLDPAPDRSTVFRLGRALSFSLAALTVANAAVYVYFRFGPGG